MLLRNRKIWVFSSGVWIQQTRQAPTEHTYRNDPSSFTYITMLIRKRNTCAHTQCRRRTARLRELPSNPPLKHALWRHANLNMGTAWQAPLCHQATPWRPLALALGLHTSGIIRSRHTAGIIRSCEQHHGSPGRMQLSAAPQLLNCQVCTKCMLTSLCQQHWRSRLPACASPW